jgi:energy-coupling factor transporter ATP-binding protein EcfA2
MRIKAVILENFRAYRSRTRIPIAALTAFIGKNDAGKSTVLEALDIFFEGGVKKIEAADASKRGDPKKVRIAIVFDNLPAQVVLDSNATTTFANEHLLNEDGDLELHKVYNCAVSTPKATVSAWAVHPNATDVGDLLQKLQKDLKTIVKDQSLENNCNLTENPSMRFAIYQAHSNLQLAPRDVPLNEDNGKAIWAAIQNYLPIFALFQSDRPSTDQDAEVQDPMKVAIKQALDQLESELDVIADKVSEKAQETAKNTLDKLQSSYPNLASSLVPKFKKPNWSSIFKLELEADDEIPLNKRGSGVRRLILMSFFQAEAEKKRADGDQQRSVVYAIEEPETSQHPDSQGLIIETFKALAKSGDQVILTTHVPGLAGLIPLDCLRYVDLDPATKNIRVRDGSADVYAEIAEALGVLPDPTDKTSVKVAVLVEGKHDIDALRSMAMVLAESNDIDPLLEDYIFWTIGGGETLKDWIERGYLDKLKLPQVIIRDSDRSAAAMPLDIKKQEWHRNINSQPGKVAFITQKRNMDNYVHINALVRLTGGKLTIPSSFDLDFHRMDNEFGDRLSDAIKNDGLIFNATDLSGNHIRARKENAKHILAAYIIRNMTADEIKERGAYTDANGKSKNEIIEWISAIQTHIA